MKQEAIRSLEAFREVNRAFPKDGPLRHWKSQGKMAMGWLCVYVPEEIIHAAGLLPVRITYDEASKVSLGRAYAYVEDSTCSFMRTCLQMGLEGQFDLLDGISFCAMCRQVTVSTEACLTLMTPDPNGLAFCYPCDGCTGLSKVWGYYIPHVPVIYTLDIMQDISEKNIDFYRNELLRFREAIETNYKVRITDAALREAIEVHNETRALLKRLYEMRQAHEPPITGAETLEVVNAAARMPKEQYNSILRDLLTEIEGRQAYGPGPRVRTMLLGSPINDAHFIKEMERLGFAVVVDELCTGGKYALSEPVDETGEPMEALAKRYIHQISCPAAMPKEVRFREVKILAKDYQVQAGVALHIRYCNNAIWAQSYLSEELKGLGIPTLELDIDYGSVFSGHFKVRLEAFLEILEGR